MGLGMRFKDPYGKDSGKSPSTALHFYSGKPRPFALRKPGGQNGPVKIIKPASKGINHG